MAPPRFRFVDGDVSPAADPQFWRDVEASERLASRQEADRFLRGLCHSRAWIAAEAARDPEACAAAERRLLADVSARGFRLFAPDHAPMATSRPVAEAG